MPNSEAHSSKTKLVSLPQAGIAKPIDFCLSDGVSSIILVHSVMELRQLKHTSLLPTVLTAILGLSWLLAEDASGLRALIISLQSSTLFEICSDSVCREFPGGPDPLQNSTATCSSVETYVDGISYTSAYASYLV